MSRKYGRYLMMAFFYFISTVIGLEMLLRVTDPFGLLIEWDKAALINAVIIDDPRGYGYRPGIWRFHNWTMTIDADGNRITPDTDTTGEKVVFIGDSVTVGFGVNDDETFVNLLASSLRLNATNRAVNGYNMPNLLRTIQQEQCACLIIWLMIPNDPNAEYRLGTPTGKLPPFLLSMYLQQQPRREFFVTLPDDLTSFWDDMNAMTADSRVRIVAFDDPLTAQAIERGYQIAVIPRYQGRLSHVDPHPNAAGHQEIEAGVEPYLRRWVTDHDGC